MNMQSFAILTSVSWLLASAAGAATLFTIGTTGTALNTNNWPGGEPPTAAIDGLAPASGNKYLNFGEVNTGYIFTLTTGTATATGINFTTAGDDPNRDPSSYRLLGSNTAVATTVAGTIYDDSSFTQISTGALTLPDARNTVGGNVTFTSTTPYNTFLLIFPTIKNAALANSMQIGEARIQTATGALSNVGTIAGGQVPEPSALVLLFMGAVSLITKRRRVA